MVAVNPELTIVLICTCTKTQEADKKASFLRLLKLGKCEITAVNGHFESRSNSLPRLFRGKKWSFPADTNLVV